MQSIATPARRSENRRYTFSVVGSLLVHAGLAVQLVHGSSDTSAILARTAGDTEPAAISVQLVRANVSSADLATPLQLKPHPSADPASSYISLSPHQGQTSTSETPPAVNETKASALAGAQQAGAESAGSRASSAAVAAAGSDYQRQLLAYIEPFKRYPDEANRAGTRGVAQLLFQLDRQGRVLGVWVTHSSGSKILDEAAVDTVRRAAPLPAIPSSLPDALAVQLPVEFSGPAGAPA